MRKITKRSAAVIAASATAVVAVGATAWATGWFNGTGSATGVTTAHAENINAVLKVSGALYPTGSFEVFGKATNPNPYSVLVTGFHIDGITAGASNTPIKADCQLNLAAPTSNWIIGKTITKMPEDDGKSLGNILTMGEYASGDCADLSNVTINVTLSGRPVNS